MKDLLQQWVDGMVSRLQAEGVLPEGALPGYRMDRPKERDHGDFSTNAAMVLARFAKMKPRDLATRLLATLPQTQTDIDRWEVAGPGFINFFVSHRRLRQQVGEIVAAGRAYGRSTLGRGEKVMVEFVSANPTGPMHVGHGRGAVTGDVLCRLLQATGYAVHREYYINDAGRQVDVLGRSVAHRCRELLENRSLPPPEEFYPGEYVVDIVHALPPTLRKDLEAWLANPRDGQGDTVLTTVTRFAVDWVLQDIRKDLTQLDISFDHWFSERSLHEQDGIKHALEILRARGWIHDGLLEKPKGGADKSQGDWEARKQPLFRATLFGDDVDRPLQKPDGQYTYFAADIAYHLNKYERGFARLVNIWGADHGGYVKRVQAALEGMTGTKDVLKVLLVQMVNLTRQGQPVRMSKRAGNFVTLRDVVEQVGSDAVRFWFLTRASVSQLDFDLDLAVARTNDNPVYYVQYAHARICSIGRTMAEKGMEDSGDDPASYPYSPDELDLVRYLDTYPEMVESAAQHLEPHRIAFYLQELAAMFHTYYNGNRILDDDLGIRNGRLALCRAVRQVLANGLELMGVKAPERM
ncbi:MAG: arginine--tRNA ligase [Magnetococcales bacterium]|nr:arginine--tRNA ligase [Magnetococcales bacterium]